jgi:hypothetical protein
MPSMEKERRQPRYGLALAIVFGLLILYVLSVGPAYRLVATERISQPAYAAIYAPIIWICLRSDVAWRAGGWYCKLWYDEEITVRPYGQPSP